MLLASGHNVMQIIIDINSTLFVWMEKCEFIFERKHSAPIETSGLLDSEERGRIDGTIVNTT
ncbi:hypothetical protein BLOT_004466 [Blomia tropicalis]|nr:hypothetical protein BLOT_004466 [Blomia tropicalis]